MPSSPVDETFLSTKPFPQLVLSFCEKKKRSKIKQIIWTAPGDAINPSHKQRQAPWAGGNEPAPTRRTPPSRAGAALTYGTFYSETT
ncbi:hypothetical protein EVAR_102715_1 [Eumeta japonica]|uniref:Uncharacterized protein n=1 Tax=Eumeta variegata TaxID=151549 RepID=A0A4C1TL41_EUMVA|nr:hypothetical protein EVAR_102715_1 [Eumeta japonica]